ncbi:MAG: LapA family protein [Zoogloeaceae bacterium]|jgi:uncharacterized integral membrane protein|nr:LapA family protein [Zoogloeaceae bacterium]
MTVLTWILRLLLFLFVLLFAWRNTAVVTLNFFYGQSWDAPLILWLLAFFVTGVLLGVLAMLAPLFRARRALTRLQREATERVPAADGVHPPQTEF